MNGWRLAAIVMAFAGAPASAASVVIENAWVRLPAPGQKVTAGYCDIRNEGDAPATVVGFFGQQRVEMHETRTRDGVARMRPMREVTVPARSTVKLVPGGKHLMLFGLDAARASETLTLRARLADGTEIAVVFEVRGQGVDKVRGRKSAGATEAK